MRPLYIDHVNVIGCKISKRSQLSYDCMAVNERGYLVRTLASRPGVPGSNPIAAPKSYEVYPGLGILHEEVFFN